jgi:hemerythrin-like domain-containing protein
MLQQPGARSAGDGASNRVVAGLLECHERIRRFGGYAQKLGGGEAFAPEEIREAAAAVARYFSVALPLHSADEDESIAPRLAGAPPDVAAAIDNMTAQHGQIHDVIDELMPLWQRLAEAPELRDSMRDQLAAGAERLQALTASHLDLEERMVLPAIDQLPAETLELIAGEMAARRRSTTPQR